LRPNDVIQWQAINDACKNGYKIFDFGEVPEKNEDLARFKSKWGAEGVRLYRYYYPIGSDSEDSSAEYRDYSRVRLADVVWRRLPLWATSWLGDQIYARL
jgi:lipid II:glycine glycyltransferase (peptidoglycan interpeptide bridge formation enzyme)